MSYSCLGCGKAPEELAEYVYGAQDEGISPSAFVESEEGTFNIETGKFWCTQCYIAAGMPLGIATVGVGK